MKNCAIICEYNPFHTGHKYQLDQVRESGVDNVFCIMSGNFVQSALPAFCDKALRSKCAVMSGVDAVIELPAVYATASAQDFAEGAVKIISHIKDMAYISMGVTADPSAILQIAEVKNKHKDKYRELFKANIERGISYNSASTTALTQLFVSVFPDKPSIEKILSEPNNILCLEYLSALRKFAPNVEPIMILRKGALHNDTLYTAEFISASAIRKADNDGRLDDVKNFIPYNFDKISEWRKHHSPDIAAFKKIAMFALKRASVEQLQQLRNCSEGMEHLMKSESKLADFDGFLNAVKSKRYSEKRLYRLFLDIILDVRRGLTDKRFCTRLLACKNGFDFSLLPSFVKTCNADIKSAYANDEEIRSVLDIDIAAAQLYNTICAVDGDYFNYSLVKV